MPFRSAVAGAVMLVGSAAWAQVRPDAGGPETSLDEGQLVSQVASFAATRLKDSPAVVTVLLGEDLRAAGARDLLDILALVPGFFAGVDTQGVVGPGFRGLWGYEGKILLLLDGKEMNEQLYSTIQLGNEFPVELIERVEVVRGPGSVIYGGNAELAVINVITRGLQGGTEVQVSGTYGQLTGGSDLATSYGRRSLSASGRWVVDQVPGLSTFLSASVGQGQRSVRPYVASDGGVAPQEGASALDLAVVQAGVAYRDFQASILYHRLATVSPAGSGPVTVPTPATFDSVHLQVQGAIRPTDRWELVPRFDLSFQRPWATPTDYLDQYYDKWVRRVRGRVTARWAPLDQLQLTAGLDGMWDAAWLNGPPLPGSLQTNFGPGDGTGRVDHGTVAFFAEAYSENPILNVSAGVRASYHTTVGASVVPRVVLLKTFGPVSLKGLFSMAFREPGVENLSISSANGVTLRPERTLVFELEASWELVKGVSLRANAFDVGIDAPIAYGQVGNDEAYKNLGYQGSLGAEVGFRARGDWGHVDLSYASYTPAQALGQVSAVDTYFAPGVSGAYLAAPNHKASLWGTWRPLRWLAVSPTVVVTSARSFLGPDGSAAELPPEVLASLFVSVLDQPVKGLSFSLGVHNLFGAEHRFPQPYGGDYAPLPGLDREVMLRVTYLWEPGAD